MHLAQVEGRLGITAQRCTSFHCPASAAMCGRVGERPCVHCRTGPQATARSQLREKSLVLLLQVFLSKIISK